LLLLIVLQEVNVVKDHVQSPLLLLHRLVNKQFYNKL
jgi:hypothetical protein